MVSIIDLKLTNTMERSHRRALKRSRITKIVSAETPSSCMYGTIPASSTCGTKRGVDCIFEMTLWLETGNGMRGV